MIFDYFTTDILIAIAAFALFMGAPFVVWLRGVLDYCQSTSSATLWYVAGVVFLLYATDIQGIFLLSGVALPFAYAIATTVLMFVFAQYWQRNGRELMPHTPYSEPATTFYDFTPRYALVKGLEIFFQNVVAAVIIMQLFSITNSVVLTGVLFGGAFFVVHAVAVCFFGIEWAVFIVIASLVAGTIPVVLITSFPGGILYLYSFHILMYLLFLLCMRRFALFNARRQL